MDTLTTAAATALDAAVPRYDIYHAIHKALRLMMSDTLGRVGRADPQDREDVSRTLAQVSDLLTLCSLHLKKENDFVHPLLERAARGSAQRIRDEHVHHAEAIADLHDLTGLVADAPAPSRAGALNRLYKALAVFVGDNLLHMNVEETEHNAVLWANYSDAQLHAFENELKASIPSPDMMLVLHWFMPALNAPERAQMLSGARAAMPAPVFAAVVDIATRTLSPRDFGKLAEAVGLGSTPAPAPGAQS